MGRRGAGRRRALRRADRAGAGRFFARLCVRDAGGNAQHLRVRRRGEGPRHVGLRRRAHAVLALYVRRVERRGRGIGSGRRLRAGLDAPRSHGTRLWDMGRLSSWTARASRGSNLRSRTPPSSPATGGSPCSTDPTGSLAENRMGPSSLHLGRILGIRTRLEPRSTVRRSRQTETPGSAGGT